MNNTPPPQSKESPTALAFAEAKESICGVIDGLEIRLAVAITTPKPTATTTSLFEQLTDEWGGAITALAECKDLRISPSGETPPNMKMRAWFADSSVAARVQEGLGRGGISDRAQGTTIPDNRWVYSAKIRPCRATVGLQIFTPMAEQLKNRPFRLAECLIGVLFCRVERDQISEQDRLMTRYLLRGLYQAIRKLEATRKGRGRVKTASQALGEHCRALKKIDLATLDALKSLLNVLKRLR